MGSFQCIARTPAFKRTAEKFGVSEDWLEAFASVYVNFEEGRDFPSDTVIQHALAGERNIVNSVEQAEMYVKGGFNNEKFFKTPLEADAYMNEAKKYFSEDAIVRIRTKDGYAIHVNPPVLSKKFSPSNDKEREYIKNNPLLKDAESFTDEENLIYSRARKDADGNLLAPNGKKSNLTPKQYVQTRTEAFKNWFGDWEHANWERIKSDKSRTKTYNKFKRSLFRGQGYAPTFDADGNLVIRTAYDSLGKVYTLSLAHDRASAEDYGYRSALNPYIIELDEDYLDTIFPSGDYDHDTVHNRGKLKYEEELGEVRLSFPGKIVIPKNKFNIYRNTYKEVYKNIDNILNGIADTLDLGLQYEIDEYNGVHEGNFFGTVGENDIKDRENSLKAALGNFKGESLFDILSAYYLLQQNPYSQIRHIYSPKNYKDYVKKGFLKEIKAPAPKYATEEALNKAYETLLNETKEKIAKRLAPYYTSIEKARASITENDLLKELAKTEEGIKYHEYLGEIINYEREYDNKYVLSDEIIDYINKRLTHLNNESGNNVSKVVDDNGEPLVVYHGTEDSFNTVDFSKSDAGQGFYATTTVQTADTYGLGHKYPLFYNLKNPYIIDGFGEQWNNLLLNEEDYTKEELKEPYKLKRLTTRDIEKFAKEHGYDGVIFKDIVDQGKYSSIVNEHQFFYLQQLFETSPENTDYAKRKTLDFIDTLRTNVFVAFNTPNQVKSATANNGTFSKLDDNIYHNENGTKMFDVLQWISRTLRYTQDNQRLSDNGQQKRILNKYRERFYIGKSDQEKAQAELERARQAFLLPEGIFTFTTLPGNNIEVTLNEDVLQDTIERNERNVNSLDKSFETEAEANAVRSVLDFLSTKTGMKYQVISAELAKDIDPTVTNTTNSFVKDGVCYFIEGRQLNVDIASEEMLHPFINALSRMNPSLFNNILNEAKKLYPKLRLEIAESYKNKSQNDREQELVTQAISRAFRVKFNSGERTSVQKLLDLFKKWVIDLFRAGNKDYILPDELKDNITINDLASILNSNLKLLVGSKYSLDSRHNEGVGKVQSYEGNITPDANTIFVFGSNPEGRHGAGAAAEAARNFGAKYGVGEGMTGNAYALPTKDLRSKPLYSEDNGKSPVTLYRGYALTENREAYNLEETVGKTAVDYDDTLKGALYFTSSKEEAQDYAKERTDKSEEPPTAENPQGGKINRHYTGDYAQVSKYYISADAKVEHFKDIRDYIQHGKTSKADVIVLDRGTMWGGNTEYIVKNPKVIIYDKMKRSISSEDIIESIKKLYDTARKNPTKQFKVAYRNTTEASLNGYTGLEMIEMFKAAGTIPINIVFSKEWVDTGAFNDAEVDNVRPETDASAKLSITPAKPVDQKASVKGALANKFIGFADGINGSSTVEYARQAGEKANMGQYNENDVIFVSIPGKRGNEKTRHEQQDRTIKEALIALQKGAILITDTKEYAATSEYNEGEKRLAAALSEAGAVYTEIESQGVKVGSWKLLGGETIEYTPKGKERQTYTVRGNRIFNKNGEEVFKEDSADRNKIFANLAVQQKRAVVVKHRESSYVVNQRNQIISVSSGKIMQWGDDNGDRKMILALAKEKFAEMLHQKTETPAKKPVTLQLETFRNGKFYTQTKVYSTGNEIKELYKVEGGKLYVFTTRLERGTRINSNGWTEVTDLKAQNLNNVTGQQILDYITQQTDATASNKAQNGLLGKISDAGTKAVARGEKWLSYIESFVKLSDNNPSHKPFTINMSMFYGDEKRDGVKANNTIDAIVNGERTSTTRNMDKFDYYKLMKVGEVVVMRDDVIQRAVLARITKAATPLSDNVDVEEWSKKEGWSKEYFEKKIRPTLSNWFTIEYEFVDGSYSVAELKSLEDSKPLTELEQKGRQFFNAVEDSKIETEFVTKAWKKDSSKANVTMRIYLKGQRDKGYFEVVKDMEDDFYSIHFKTARKGGQFNTANTKESTKEERKELFLHAIAALPAGAKVSTWGEISKDGVKGIYNIGRDMVPIETREVTSKETGEKILIPVYQKYGMFSGNADGSDKTWAAEGQQYGLTTKHFQAAEYRELTNEEINEVELEYDDARRFLGRWAVPIKNINNDRDPGIQVRRDMMQADAADVVYAIAQRIIPVEGIDVRYGRNFVNKTEHENVAGGTGYAVARAIRTGKTVYVYDQSAKIWKTYRNGKFIPINQTPMLVAKSAVIGTRGINEDGKAAIQKVLSNFADMKRKAVASLGKNVLKGTPSENLLKGSNKEEFKGVLDGTSNKELNRLRREYAGDAEAMEILGDLTPQTLEEVAAKLLERGVKLRLSDDGSHKGVLSEMGYSRKDVPFLLAYSKKDGLTVAKFGEAILQAAREEFHVNFDEDDAMAGVNAAIEMLSSLSIGHPVSDYIASNRIANLDTLLEERDRQRDIYEQEMMQRNLLQRETNENDPTLEIDDSDDTIVEEKDEHQPIKEVPTVTKDNKVQISDRPSVADVNSRLNNATRRPFSVNFSDYIRNVIGDVDLGTQHFESVSQALQYIKVAFFSNEENQSKAIEVLGITDATELERLSKELSKNFKEEAWNEIASALKYFLMRESFKQNPSAKELLMSAYENEIADTTDSTDKIAGDLTAIRNDFVAEQMQKEEAERLALMAEEEGYQPEVLENTETEADNSAAVEILRREDERFEREQNEKLNSNKDTVHNRTLVEKIDALIDSNIPAVEIRKVATQVVHEMSDLLTEIQNNPEDALFEEHPEYSKYADKRREGTITDEERMEDVTRIQSMSRMELLQMFGNDEEGNLIFLEQFVKPRMFRLGADTKIRTLREASLYSENFSALLKLANDEFVKCEGFSIVSREGKSSVETADTESIQDNFGNSEKEEEEIADERGNQQEHWQVESRTQDVIASMSVEVRRTFSSFYLLNEDGSKQKSKFGVAERVEDRDAVNQVLNWCRGCLTLEAMINAIESKQSKSPWVKQLVDKLRSTEPADTVFQSQFYTVFEKHFQSYSVVTRDAETGVLSSKIVNENAALKEAQNTIKTQFKLGTHPLFQGEDSEEEINKLYALGERIAKNIVDNTKTAEFSQEALDDVVACFEEVNAMLGWAAQGDIVRNALMGKEGFSNANSMLNNLKKMADAIKNGNEEVAESNNLKIYDPFEYGTRDELNRSNTGKNNIISFLRNYLRPMTNQLEDTIVSTCYDSGKTYQSYVTPSYLTKLMNKFRGSKADFDKFMMEKFHSDWYYNEQADDYICPWLRVLDHMSEKDRRDMFKHKVQLNFAGRNYMKDLTDSEYVMSVISEYFCETAKAGAKQVPAWFKVPIMSNKPSLEFIKFYRYTGSDYKNTLKRGFYRIFLQELSRIQTCRIREASGITKSSPNYIKNFDENGKKFCFLSYMNDYLEGGKKSHTELGKLIDRKLKGNIKEDDTNSLIRLEELTHSVIEEEMNNISSRILDSYKENGILKAAEKIQGINGKSEETVRAALEEFIWNDAFASMNIFELTIGDTAFYANAEDLQKRLAQIHAPGIRGNVNAVDFKGKSISDGNYRTLILKDFEGVKSNIIENLRVVFDKKLAAITDETQRATTKEYYDSILKMYEEEINVADAQGYTSPTAYRKKALMFGKWNQKAETIYNNLLTGQWTASDLQTAFQPLKPFIYSQIQESSHVEAPLRTLDIPVQFKNSEYLLVMAGAILKNEDTGRPNILRALYRIMEETAEKDITKCIDTIQFESTTKSGLHAKIDLNQFLDKPNGEELAYQHLRSKVYKSYTVETPEGIENNAVGEKAKKEMAANPLITYTDEYNDEFVRTVPMEDFSIQQENPEHFKEHEQAHGSQIRAITPSDLVTGAFYEYDIDVEDANGAIHKKHESKGAEEFRREYEETIAENIQESLEELKKELLIDATGDTPNHTQKEINVALSRILQREILSSPRYGVDLLLACSVNEEGEFRIPIGDPIQSKRIEQLINSIIKNRVNKQEIAGGPVVQVSNFGMSKQLNIVFKDKNGNTLLTRSQWMAQNNFAEKAAEEGIDVKTYEKQLAEKYLEYVRENQGGIAYYECFAPAWSNELFRKFADKDGNIDIREIERANPDLLKMIGYRIPTEDKYSAAPLKIVGFLPREAGEGIMMPYEITLITGSDFDVDKFYLMRKVGGIKAAYEEVDPKTSQRVYKGERDYINRNRRKLVNGIYANLSQDVRRRMMDIIKERKSIKEQLNDIEELQTKAIEAENKQHNEKIAELEKSKSRFKTVGISNENSRHKKVLADINNSPAYKESLEHNHKILLDAVEKEIKISIDVFLSNPHTREDNNFLINAFKDAYSDIVYQATYETKGRNFRNNKIIDMTWAVLTHEEHAYQVLNPGGFNEQKRSGYLVGAARIGIEEQNLKELKAVLYTQMRHGKTLAQQKEAAELYPIVFGAEENPYAVMKLIDSGKLGVDSTTGKIVVYDKDNKNIKKGTDGLKLICMTSKNLCFIDANTQFYKQNNAAGTVLGMFAVQKVAHAMLEGNGYMLDVNQICDLPVIEKTDAEGNLTTYVQGFSIAGMKFGGENSMIELDRQTNVGHGLIGKSVGSLVASAADAVKDPVLNYNNINQTTAKVLTTLIRLGMTYDNAALFLSQKAITEALNKFYVDNLTSSKSFDSVIKEILENLCEEHNINNSTDTLNNSPLNSEELTVDEMERGVTSDSPEIQIKVLQMYQKISKLSKKVDAISYPTRFNSISNAVGPAIIDNLVMEEKLDTRTNPEKYTGIYRNGKAVDAEDVFKLHPILDKFRQTLNIANTLFKGLNMPAVSNGFNNVLNVASDCNMLGSLMANRKTLVKLSDFYQSFLLAESGAVKTENGGKNGCRYYIYEFPREFLNNRSDASHPWYKFRNNELIKAIQPEVDKATGTVVLQANVVGLDTSYREKLSNAWIDLYKSGEEGRQLSDMLFNYCFFRGGIGFSPKTFMSLLPTYVKERMKSYIDTYKNLPSISTQEARIILDQFVRNNANEYSLVKRKVLGKDGSYKRNETVGVFRPSGEWDTYPEYIGVPVKKTILKNGNPIIQEVTALFRKDINHAEAVIYKEISTLGRNNLYLDISTSSLSYVGIDASYGIAPIAVSENTENQNTSLEQSYDDEQEAVPVTAAEKQRNVDNMMEQLYKGLINVPGYENTIEKNRTRVKRFKDYIPSLQQRKMEKTKEIIRKAFKSLGIELNEEAVQTIFDQMC